MYNNFDSLDEETENEIKHTMGLSAFDDQYKVPIIARLLHSLPHYNITFHRTNDTFRPTDEVYLEVSLLIEDTGISFNGLGCRDEVL